MEGKEEEILEDGKIIVIVCKKSGGGESNPK